MFTDEDLSCLERLLDRTNPGEVAEDGTPLSDRQKEWITLRKSVSDLREVFPVGSKGTIKFTVAE